MKVSPLLGALVSRPHRSPSCPSPTLLPTSQLQQGTRTHQRCVCSEPSWGSRSMLCSIWICSSLNSNKTDEVSRLRQQLFLAGVSMGMELPAVSWAPPLLSVILADSLGEISNSSPQTSAPAPGSGLQGVEYLQALWPCCLCLGGDYDFLMEMLCDRRKLFII